MINPLVYVLHADPIDRQAGRVASQKGCLPDMDITYQELIFMYNKQIARRKELSIELGLTTKTKRHNFKSRLKKNVQNERLNRTLCNEYVALGDSICRLIESMTASKAALKNTFPNKQHCVATAT